MDECNCECRLFSPEHNVVFLLGSLMMICRRMLSDRPGLTSKYLRRSFERPTLSLQGLFIEKVLQDL